MTEPTTTDLTSLFADGTAAGTWVLDSAGSHAGFANKHFWGAITVRGSFERMTGEAAVGPDGTVTGRISFDARSLNTKNKQRESTCAPPTSSTSTTTRTPS
jgi:polyisoprenoid-binding protein YceI